MLASVKLLSCLKFMFMYEPVIAQITEQKIIPLILVFNSFH